MRYIKTAKRIKKLELKLFFGKILCGVFLFNIINGPPLAYAKMYLWKDEKGSFNASEEKPGWWPAKTNCIAWDPGKKNKVIDFALTQKKMKTCEVDIKEEKKIIKKKRAVEPELTKKIIEQTDREIRIYCAYRKTLMQFLNAPNTEELSVQHISEQFEINENEVQTITSKVVDFKGGDYKCTY